MDARSKTAREPPTGWPRDCQHHACIQEYPHAPVALLNFAMAAAAIACWEAKYHYVFWRPVTAIPLEATDGNPDTVEDLTWTPVFVTPNHPE